MTRTTPWERPRDRTDPGGFLVLRRTSPDAERPIRLAPVWIPIAVLLLVFNLFMIVIGFTHPALIGYGGGTEQLIALSVIVVGLVSYFFTRRVQLGLRGRRLWQDLPDRPAQEAVSVRSGS